MNYTEEKDLTYYPSNLTEEYSPSLPRDFPLNKIPGVIRIDISHYIIKTILLLKINI